MRISAGDAHAFQAKFTLKALMKENVHQDVLL